MKKLLVEHIEIFLKTVLVIRLLFSITIFASFAQKNEIDISGNWQFTTNQGNWSQTIMLPGSMTSNGLGNDVTVETPWTGNIVDRAYFTDKEYAPYRQKDNIKVPFWLQPVKYYKGEAWYKKEVRIPVEWKEKYIELFLERCHWETTLFVDGVEVGMQNSLSTPHRYGLSKVLTPGTHELMLRVDNRIKNINPGENAHSISDHTQGNWNGVIGKMCLIARPQINVSRTDIFPDISKKSIQIKVLLQNRENKTINAEIKFSANKKTVKRKIKLSPGVTSLEDSLFVGEDALLWNEFSPKLYDLTVELEDLVFGTKDIITEQFGLREIRVRDKEILLNGQPVFFRGALDCAAFPKTGFPPTDKGSWKKIMTTCKSYGLNHLRFHSWCPPEAAFCAADELGMYLEVECSTWSNQIGAGKDLDTYLWKESEAMVREYGNHPSFCMMMAGNEPAKKKSSPFLTDFVSNWKKKDDRRLYSSAGGWPNLPVNDFLSDARPRIQGWGAGLKSIINAKNPQTDFDFSGYVAKYNQPMICHETGQWCVYPNFREIKKYDGVMCAKNFEIFRESLRNNGLAHLADSFLLASGKLQVLCYKADIEAALRTKNMTGFQLLGLADFPGQGTALVGVLDAFWEEKGYTTASEYRRFCSETVLLVRLPKLIYTNEETLQGRVEIAHYGARPVKNANVGWSFKDSEGKVYKSGVWKEVNISVGDRFEVGDFSIPLSGISEPKQMTFEVTMGEYENDWHIWVYPGKKEKDLISNDILLTDTLDAKTLAVLNKGGKVLLSLKKGSLSKEYGGNVRVGFSSIFWNTAWTGNQPPHTLGILCNPKHPVFNYFPTSYHSDYQWWDAMTFSSAIEYSKISASITPLVRVIDDWFTNRPLALLFEVKVNNGSLLVSGIDFWNKLGKRPEAQQLLYSIEAYMSSKAFAPAVELSVEQIRNLSEL